MSDQIEQLKRRYTDQYVVVADASRPELARFQGLTGQVKTVNMSGRTLVQFDANNNIGWYDINPDFLKIVPKPEPKPEEEKHAKPKAAAAAAPKTEAPAKPPAAKPAAAGEKKPSVAEMLRAQAAAKKAGGTAPAASAPVKSEAPAASPVAETTAPEPAKPQEAPAGEKKKLSTAEILAALKKKP